MGVHRRLIGNNGFHSKWRQMKGPGLGMAVCMIPLCLLLLVPDVASRANGSDTFCQVCFCSERENIDNMSLPCLPKWGATSLVRFVTCLDASWFHPLQFPKYGHWVEPVVLSRNYAVLVFIFTLHRY